MKLSNLLPWNKKIADVRRDLRSLELLQRSRNRSGTLVSGNFIRKIFGQLADHANDIEELKSYSIEELGGMVDGLDRQGKRQSILIQSLQADVARLNQDVEANRSAMDLLLRRLEYKITQEPARMKISKVTDHDDG